MTASPDRNTGFSPVENELPIRWLRRLHLVPEDGLGIWRRALFFAALTWLPIVVWASIAGRLWESGSGESLLRHYGVNVRCLIAIPLFILAEGSLHQTVKGIASHFVSTGILGPSQQAAFDRILSDARRVRDSSLPWVLVIGATLGWG